MKLIYCLMIMLCPFLCCAQVNDPIHVGETVPDIEITHVYNYPVSFIKLSKFKGRLTILDFWATFCSSCIKTFPKMQALKNEFGDSLQLLFVNQDLHDTRTRVNAFFENRKIKTGHSFELPYILGDSVLSKRFPHFSIPHCVWLDSALRVIAITDHTQVTGDNIRRFFSGARLSLPIKNGADDYNPDKPFLVDNNGGPGADFIYRSILTRNKENLEGSFGKIQPAIDKISKLYFVNSPLFSIFKTAYPGVLKYRTNRTFIEVPDSLLFKRANGGTYSKQQRYCYELTTSPVSLDKILRYLRDDLERNFNVVAKNERRLIDCYILTSNNYISRSVTKGGPSSIDIEEKDIHKYFKNTALAEFASFLDGTLDKPVINEMTLAKNIDIQLPTGYYDFSPQEKISYLFKQGFVLTLAKRWMEVAVLTQSNN